MKPKGALTTGRRSGQTQKRQSRSTEPERVTELGEETERPLDAEDIALASLEAQVRAKEARADLGSTELSAVVAVRLPHALIVRFEAEATKRCITASELIKRALIRYLS
ncbi:MAG: hypothetical protein F9K13_04790 [Candidatus Methylomirabilis oxygeniifera]|uniref:Ribbon-helix-helix protein CopG domain-containing protein n=1 Tax=Methylomirabilis oxygeniifera TaxID=671143 RepID=D5MMV4_METO1|nr:MAG: hypothetical protein F9K13_04790 [Candidatus Methylomirabilis oxyfera]CBE68054.1 protein of unknown function [Candidatus Methylomirabilis oxyfera]